MELGPNTRDDLEAEEEAADLAREATRAGNVDEWRRRTIEGLREAADFLEAHPDVPVPWQGFAEAFGPDDTPAGVVLNVTVGTVVGAEEEIKGRMAEIARAGGRVEKLYSGAGDYLTLRRTFGGGAVKLDHDARRENVCTARVVGTETVEEPVMEQVGTTTRERQIVEWDCEPILRPSTEGGEDA